MNKKGFAVLPILIIIALLGIVGYFLCQNTQFGKSIINKIILTIFPTDKSRKVYDINGNPRLLPTISPITSREWKEYTSNEGYKIKYPIITYKELENMSNTVALAPLYYKEGKYRLPEKIINPSTYNYEDLIAVEDITYLPIEPTGSGLEITVYDIGNMTLDQFWKKIAPAENCDDTKKSCFSWGKECISFDEYPPIDGRKAVKIYDSCAADYRTVYVINNSKGYMINAHFYGDIEDEMISSIKFIN